MLQTVLSTFAMIFLAELGDKTQLAVVALSTGSRSPTAVFLGASGALIVSSALAVALGAALSRFVPGSAAHLLHRLAGVLFVLVGAWTIWKA